MSKGPKIGDTIQYIDPETGKVIGEGIIITPGFATADPTSQEDFIEFLQGEKLKVDDTIIPEFPKEALDRIQSSLPKRVQDDIEDMKRLAAICRPLAPRIEKDKSE